MSMRTIVEFNHDMAHEVGREAQDVGAYLCVAMKSGNRESWEPLERFGIQRVVMVHHSDDRAVRTRSTIFDIGEGTQYLNPEVELRRALRLIADGKSQPTANNVKKWPVSVARIALGRDYRTNEPTDTKIDKHPLTGLYAAWTPIEYAPRDGTMVDLWVGQRVPDCTYKPERSCWNYLDGETGGTIYDDTTPETGRRGSFPVATHFMVPGTPPGV